MYAVIRVRGSVKTPGEVRETLKMLRLTRVNHCTIVPKDKTYEGMLAKARHYITWGEIDESTLEKLVSKRGRLEGNKRVGSKNAKDIAKKIIKAKSLKGVKDIKRVFRLSPPSGGYKSTKLPFPRGDLGYRGEKINSLLKRMI